MSGDRVLASSRVVGEGVCDGGPAVDAECLVGVAEEDMG